jgi:hypothetical protein
MRALVTPGVKPTTFTELSLEDTMKSGREVQGTSRPLLSLTIRNHIIISYFF